MPIGHVEGVGSLRINLLKAYLCVFDPTIIGMSVVLCTWIITRRVWGRPATYVPLVETGWVNGGGSVFPPTDMRLNRFAQRDCDGFTPFIIAAQTDNAPVMEFLGGISLRDFLGVTGMKFSACQLNTQTVNPL